MLGSTDLTGLTLQIGIVERENRGLDFAAWSTLPRKRDRAGRMGWTSFTIRVLHGRSV